ncbi:MAG: DUF1109 domain-containing protein [bacterium]|nr:DUF1109 domain-containing protein [bacterium]MCP5065134.1 DUF1109 domain-containing protein [bacterium]
MNEDRSEPVDDGRSEDLIRELARELEPVQPLPPLRFVVGGLLGLWALVAAVGVAVLGSRPDLAQAWLGRGGVAFVFGGLGLAGVAGLAASVALGVPGRERLVRLALLAAGVGMVLAAGGGSLLFLESAMPWNGGGFRADLDCLAVALVVGIFPGLGVVAFAGRAAAFRPVVLVVAAAASAAALGTIVAQASCPMVNLRHLLMGHALAPAVGVLVLSVPLLVALRRIGRVG